LTLLIFNNVNIKSVNINNIKKLNKLYLKVSLLNIITMDDSDYYSESASDSDTESESESEIVEKKITKPIQIKPNINIESDDDDDDDDEDNSDDDEDDDNYSNIEKPENQLENDDDDDDEEDEDIELDEDGEPIQNIKQQQKIIKAKKESQIILGENEDYLDDDQEDIDENYLQKFDSEITKNYINDFHPECLMHNYEEIAKLAIVVRNSENIIIDPLHKTIPYLTKYEKTRILGQRAKQIEAGSKPFIKVPENIIDGYVIAELELREKKIPFIIRRPIPSGGSEYWKISDLEIIDF
jgi:DNA-directed RNA polymerase I, II, and III subunit RPABC2